MDVVYTYVDGGDQKWTDKKINYMKSDLNSDINNIDSYTSNRFHSRNELKYSLRSLEKNLPFIRKIYIVTDNQKPDWLLENHKLQIIDHKDIIDSKYLPTFNSHVIEANIHKIPNLSDVFLYMNDDIFIGKPMSESDFYNEDKVSVFLDTNYTKKGNPTTQEYGYRSAWKNVNNWLDNNFKVERRKKMAHCPSVIYKSVMKTLWDKLYNELELTCTRRFRSITDYSITCSLHPYYCLYKNKGYENNNINTKTLYLSSNIIKDSSSLDNLYEFVPHIFCLEDDIHDSIEETDLIIRSFLEKCFPEPSSFEK